ncbi:MAG TPA: hypothetical protein VG733_15320, partial [Chthoniobacteraceae bacterium]|nr:hypothetical protein [Chthoniobacteraceae bacterium]
MKLPRLFVAFAAASSFATVCPAQQNTAPQVVVVLLDGSRLLGTLPASTAFPAQEGSLAIPIKRIDTITMGDDHRKATVALSNGDKLDGTLAIPPLPLTTLLGTVPVDLRVVKTLSVLATADSVGTDGLVFSNTLGSDMDLAHSIVGPPVKPYTDPKNGDSAPGEHEFVQGDHGKAVTIKGTYQNGDWVHMLELDGLDKLINPEEGTIEFWYCQKAPPLDWQYGVYR